MSALVKRLETMALPVLRGIGRLGSFAPEPPWATGGYGLASRGGLILLFLIGLLLSFWLTGAGLAIMIIATMALLQFYLLQYRGALRKRSTMLWLAAVALILGAVVAVIWSRWSGRQGVRGDVMVLGAVLGCLAGLPLVRVLFRAIFGPHHPESTLPEPQDPAPLWFWIGAVGPDRATIVARLADGVDANSVSVEYTSEDQIQHSGNIEVDQQRFARIELSSLDPSQHYDLRVDARRGEETVGSALGGFTTFPPAMEPSTVRLAFGSCMSTGSRGTVFDTIADTSLSSWDGPRPQLFMVTGDLHYENITARSTKPFLEAFDKVHTSPPQRRLYNSMPMAYVWDDHDYGDNDSGHDSPSRDAAQTAYRLAVPSYVDPGQAGAINQEFSIGRVRVVVTDNRSERGETPGHLLSPTQEQWLIDCITDPTWPVVIWVSSTPWISSDDDSDNWGAYAKQRRRIADAISTRSANLVMVSGDAHMVAIDDGRNAAYASDGSGGFPVLQAAALDRLGSAKGGRFSHGKFGGAGHFGIVTVKDEGGSEIEVELSARSWTGTEIVGHSFTITVQDPSLWTPHNRQEANR
ncbi:MAG: alkaline phosphatase D family protein [Acidimicrobiales bacterium]